MNQNTHRLSLVIAALAAALSAVTAQPTTDADGLRRLAFDLRTRNAFQRQQSFAFARLKGLPLQIEDANGGLMEFVRFERGLPLYLATQNADEASTVHTDELWSGGGSNLNLTGNGIKLGIWDGGSVRATHTEFGSRVTNRDAVDHRSHATHVAGTMIAAGLEPSARGMANGATLDSYDWTDDDAEMAEAAADGLRISNHSYGLITGWNFDNGAAQWYWYGDPSISQNEDYRFGFYTQATREWDLIANQAPYYLICASAGNDRNDNPPAGVAHFVWNDGWVNSTRTRERDGGANGFDTINGTALAKNILTVGAAEDFLGGVTNSSDARISEFSSFGPTDDGRIKPDLCAAGVDVWSTNNTSNTAYSSKSGTSMASPVAAGSIALWMEHYKNRFSGGELRSATWKAIAIHSASEAGASVGPDYKFGWGILNSRGAVNIIDREASLSSTITEDRLTHRQKYELRVFSLGGPLKATLAWNDPAGTPVAPALDPANRMLVNDLDLRIVRGSAVQQPWVLNPASPSNGATRGDNTRDNVEQVLLPQTTVGWYTIRVSHKGTIGNQRFSLVVTGQDSFRLFVDSLRFRATSLKSRARIVGEIELDAETPEPATLRLRTSHPDLIGLPATVTIPANAKKVTFTVQARTVRSITNATIRVESPNNAKEGGLRLIP